MTDKINAIIERSSSDIQRAPIVKAVVNRDGARAIDTASITIPAGYRVSVNDTISYIQDDAALTYLVALWNFQGSTRDEGGYHHDGDTASAYIEPEGLGNYQAYRTNYGLNFTTAGQEVTVADNTDNGVSGGDNGGRFNPTTLDFRHQFDIIINFKSMDNGGGSHTNTTQILFSKHDGTNGVEIGIKQVSAKWVIYAKLDSTTFTGNGTLYTASVDIGKIDHNDQTGATRCIRFYRDNTNRVRLSLDGAEDGTNCTQDVATNTNARPTTALKIGSNGTDDFKGFIFQIRVYCGGFLDENDFQTLMSAGAQQMTQKISGNVWRREESLENVTVEIRSRSRSILDSEVNFDIINDNTTNTLKPATHTKNLFEGDQAISDILQTIINYVDDEFVYLKSPAISNANTIQLSYNNDAGKYLAVGRFIKNVELLTTMANRSFLTFPTKTFVWEENTDGTSTKLNSGYTFSDSEYQIYYRGEDDTKVINDLELFGYLQYSYKETNFGALSSVTANTALSTTFAFPPLNVTLVQGAANYENGGANGLPIPEGKYHIDFNERTLTFNATSWTTPTSVANDYIWAKYVYEIHDGMTIQQGGTDTNTRHLRTPTTSNPDTDATTSQGIYGIRSAKVYIPQFLNQSTFYQYAQKFFDKSTTAKRRYTIKAPFLVNCLRENLQVTLSSTTMKFTNTEGTAEDETTKLEPIKSIHWKYPECETIIECGDHVYDLYDSSKDTNDTAGTTHGSILKTQSDA